MRIRQTMVAFLAIGFCAQTSLDEADAKVAKYVRTPRGRERYVQRELGQFGYMTFNSFFAHAAPIVAGYLGTNSGSGGSGGSGGGQGGETSGGSVFAAESAEVQAKHQSQIDRLNKVIGEMDAVNGRLDKLLGKRIPEKPPESGGDAFSPESSPRPMRRSAEK